MNDLELLKEKAIVAVQNKLQERLDTITSALESAQVALTEETKSSAGDKYETSREMLQQDIDRYQNQLIEAEKDSALFLRLLDTAQRSSKQIKRGDLVKTDRTLYYIAVSTGAMHIDSHTIYGISGESPIGNLLLGKRVEEQIVFNGSIQTIQYII